MAEYDLLIRFTGNLAPEVTGVDAFLYAYNRIGYGALDGGSVAFTGNILDDKYKGAAGFTAQLMGAEEGVITNDSRGRIELTYNVEGLEPLVLRDSDKSIIPVKKSANLLIDIAICGVIYENLANVLESALESGRGVNNSIHLSTGSSLSDETTNVKSTYNIITNLAERGRISDIAAYNELYYASQITVIASAIYGYISSGKRFY
jgi:hypothetical protein